MRSLATSLLAYSLLVAADAHAQPIPPRCQESATQYAGLPGTDPFTVSIRPDVRGLAGFAPAFVVSVSVPAGSTPVNFDETVRLEGKAFSADIIQKRSEYWPMGHFPRQALAVADTKRLAAIDDKGSTLYNFYYQVPEQTPEQFFVKVPQAKTSTEARSLPEVEFQRGNGKSGLVACLWPE